MTEGDGLDFGEKGRKEVNILRRSRGMGRRSRRVEPACNMKIRQRPRSVVCAIPVSDRLRARAAGSMCLDPGHVTTIVDAGSIVPDPL